MTDESKSRLEEIRNIRLSKIKKMRDMGINPYPPFAQKDLANKEVKDNFDKYEGKVVTLSGRLMSWREHGHIIFGQLRDQSGDIQVFVKKEDLGQTDAKEGALGFDDLGLLDIGDFVEVTGSVTKSTRGEISIVPQKLRIIGKSIRPLPEKWHGLTDIEERFRKRYLDILLNEKVRDRFLMRTKLTTEIRNYLDDLGFIEVETPILQPLYGGANAKPFITHLNALSADMYLRIADELYLKRLLVGGFERVYEIAKDFRNEGMDQTHNPEFTMIEYYEAYADYHRVMDVTEGLFQHLAQKLYGTSVLEVGEHKVDIGGKWPRVVMTDSIKQHLDFDVLEKDRDELYEFASSNGVTLVGGESKGQLIFAIFDNIVAPKLIEPTWIIDYPKDISPLSKDHREKVDFVERFEGYIGGKEICDGWSELTDPIEQRKRFESDVKAVREDKEEAQQVDEDFLEAMEYGMPPIGGIGIGIDRLTMFFTNVWSIKEVILYPTMKSSSLRSKRKKK